eukprot:4123839-Karenia_brevis.AAC.1
MPSNEVRCKGPNHRSQSAFALSTRYLLCLFANDDEDDEEELWQLETAASQYHHHVDNFLSRLRKMNVPEDKIP